MNRRKHGILMKKKNRAIVRIEIICIDHANSQTAQQASSSYNFKRGF